MKKLILSIIIPATMVCCQSENNEQEVSNLEREHKCWYANLIGDDLQGIGRSHTDDHLEYDGKIIHLNETTTFNYHCFVSDRYTDDQMKNFIKNKY